MSRRELVRWLWNVLRLAAMSTPTSQVVADVWHCKDTCTCLQIHKQPPWLLQQLACCTVSVTACWRSYKPFRTQLLGWWREHESSTTSRRCFVNFTGFQSTSSSCQRIRYNLAMTAYKCWVPTWTGADVLCGRLSGNLCHCWQATLTNGPLAPGYCQYQEQGPRWGWGVSQSQVHSSGTVY